MDVKRLEDMLRPSVEALGFQLWGVEYTQGRRHATLRLYIDHADGISIDDCADVSHQVSGVLDVEDPIHGEYDLEVSSPGMDRPLFRLEQYGQFEGSKAKFRLFSAIGNRRNFTGKIAGLDGDNVIVEVDDERIEIPFTSIDKARIEPEF